jgi:hypothetical protein
MVIDAIKTTDKKEALAILGRHLDSPELLYASMEYLDGVFSVKVQKPSHTCDDENDPQAQLIDASTS